MADSVNEDASSSKKLIIKRKLRGPYNQYLSQPGLKIPRTTLRRWPQNFSTSIADVRSEDISTASMKTDDALLSSDFTHTEISESSHSFSSQTAVPFETDDCESYFSQYEGYDHEQGDQSDTLDEPLKPSKLAEILAEDEQEGIEDYLEAFDSDESSGNENTDEQGRESADLPLYSGAPITVAVSMLLIITFAIRHNLTGLALVDLLTLVSLHCALPNQCASSVDLVKKFFMKLKNPIQFHYYCSFCMEYQGLSLADDKLCKNRSCLKDKFSYFIIIPLICQLKDLIEKDGILDLLSYPNTRRKVNPNAIEDIQDGLLYKKHFGSDGYFKGTSDKKKKTEKHISFQVNTDGVALFRSSKYSIWPIYLAVNELPPNSRFARSNSIFLGLWFGYSKPDFLTFLQPFSKEFQDIYSKGMVLTNNAGKEITLRGILLCGTADAPAKCLMQNFVQFNGFYGCPYCMERGKSVQTSARGHSHVYPFNRDYPLKGYETERTHESTLQHAYDAHKSKLEGKYSPKLGVKGYSWFMFIPGFDIIKGISIDYMHCVLLGVTKMLMTLWFDKVHIAEDWNIYKKVEEVERRLLNIKPPNCISRIPRSIVKDFSHWKASEFRSFLFFYGIPCLWNILPDDYYQHFILLVEAIWLLDQNSVSPDCLQKAHNLLRHFCLRIEALYGSRYDTFNVHCLLHLHDCVKNIGPLWACSCFWYEDYNGDLRRLFHGTNKVELQIAFSVCVQQKIPELVPLLPHGSSSKEFYEHMTHRRYALKCKREEISKNIFALGVMSPAALSAAVTHCVESKLSVRISRAFTFKRIQVNQDIIHSKSYLNVNRRNSSTVYVNDLGFVEVKLYIKVFAHCQNPLFCSDSCSCQRPSYYGIADCCLQPADDVTISKDNFTNCKPCHIIPVKSEKCSMVIFPVTSITALCILVDCKSDQCMFVCKLPNRYEKD